MIINNLSEVLQQYNQLPTGTKVAIDFETNGLRPWADQVQVVALHAVDCPPAALHIRGQWPPELLKLLERFMLVGHNITTFDVPFLLAQGWRPQHPWYDTMILEQLLLTSGRRDSKKTLQATLKRRLGVKISKDVDHAAWSNEELTAGQLKYVLEDITHLLPLVNVQLQELHQMGMDEAIITEQGAQFATAWMCMQGVPCLEDALIAYIDQTTANMQKILSELQQRFGLENPRSPQQVKEAFQQMGLNLQNTTDHTLHSLETSGSGPIAYLAGQIREYRQLAKVAMYDQAWRRKYIFGGRIRSRYMQMGTDTGRYSCSDPNMQQWPKKMRPIVGYAPDADRILLWADFSQIEILVAAVLFKDNQLAHEVLHGDVHTMVAKTIFGPDITPEQRRIAKAASFTLLFAGGRPGLIRAAMAGGVQLNEAQANYIIQKFFGAFQTIATGIARIRRQVDYNKKRNLPMKLRIPKGPVRSVWKDLSASRVVNTLVQGAAAAGLKRALGQLHEAGADKYVAAVVHDEIVLDVPKQEVEDVAKILTRAMQCGMEEIIGYRPRVSVTINHHWQ